MNTNLALSGSQYSRKGNFMLSFTTQSKHAAPVLSQTLNTGQSEDLELNSISDRKVFADKKSDLRYKNDFSELDIYGVLSELVPPKDKDYPRISSDELISLIKSEYNVSGNVILGKGVKDLWYKVCSEKLDSGYRVVLPSDIYPRYYDEVNKKGISVSQYSTLDGLTIPDILPSKSIMVITNPHTYHAKNIDATSINELKKWLAESSDRRIFIDAVYNYGQKIDQGSEELLKTGQVYYCTSLSKTHLCPKVVGLMVDAPQDIMFETDITDERASFAHQLISNHSNISDTQRALFKRCWDRFEPELREIDPDFSRPQTGYLALINSTASHILSSSKSLCLPISITGAKDSTKSMISMAKPSSDLLK